MMLSERFWGAHFCRKLVDRLRKYLKQKTESLTVWIREQVGQMCQAKAEKRRVSMVRI